LIKDNLNLKIDEEILYGMFRSRALRYADRECLRFKRGDSYESLSWKEVHERILHLAGYLLKNGLQKGDRVALLSENRPEWAISDLAVVAIGCITVPIYPTLAPKEIEQILQDSGSRFLFVSTPSLRQNLPFWKGPALLFDETSYADALAEGASFRHKEEEAFRNRLQEVQKNDVATIIYTSGTTGESKGVMLSHDNFLSNCRACSDAIPISEEDLYLSFLPLSHVFERMAGFYFFLSRGGTVAYAENMDTVFQNMQEVQPTVVSGVPRFFEKVQEAILASVSKKKFMERALFFWAVQRGREKARFLQHKTPIAWHARLQYPFALFLVLRKLRRKIGKRLRFFISGSAPLSMETLEFFASFHCLILEGYGLTETSPVISVNRMTRIKWGSVGLPISGVGVKIAEDGEILVKGPNVMQGYFRREDLTQASFQGEYLLTGDIGFLDSEGFLTITDRKKDLIKTSGGKYVSPQKVESLLKKDPLIEEAVIFGEKRKYIVALIVPHFKALEMIAEQKNLPSEPANSLLSHPVVLSLFHERIDRCLRDLASFEKVKKFALLTKAFTQGEGELTPTLKVKRKLLYEKYRDLIESLYEETPSNKN